MKTPHLSRSLSHTGAIGIILIACLMSTACEKEERSDATSTVQPTNVANEQATSEYAGSLSCRPCHERFYELWSTSHHGLAMQPFTDELAKQAFTPHTGSIKVGDYSYHMDIETGVMHETGPDGEQPLKVVHVMGGKNVFYLLTALDRGRLQVLPAAYDVNRKEWYHTTDSMVRHFQELPDDPIHWTDPLLTFNRACYSCHVSQLAKNYDLEADSYQTTWTEPGINCETCHGPAKEHNAIMAKTHGESTELGLISTKPFTHDQNNAMCGPCHAKGYAITASFSPGERFFDHYHLTGYEDRDWYADGRDLGENFTYTHWLTSPCVQDGELDCLHCHTSSGRFRQADNPNQACMPCHESHVNNPTAHSHHKADSEGNLCVTCHMPETEFARMKRHDHTMLAPAPAATIAFKSPNACNICHTEETAEWSDKCVREWYERDYQKPLLDRGQLIDAARKQDWSQLPKMIAYLTDGKSNPVFVASLIRLLGNSADNAKWPAILTATEHASPLVRASAVTALGQYNSLQSVEALQKAVSDEYRLVRIEAARSLTFFPIEPTPAQAKATEEFVTSLMAQPDQPGSHYNLGNYHYNRNELPDALRAFNTSLRLDPNNVLSLVNVSMTHIQLDNPAAAQKALERALRIQPDSVQANFNYGLLMAELEQFDKAEKALRAALESDPTFAIAAYNLAILVSKDRPDEALKLIRQAHEADPDNHRYTYTYAYYLYASGDLLTAEDVLTKGVADAPDYLDMYMLLGQIHEIRERFGKAKRAYLDAASIQGLDDNTRMQIYQRIEALDNR